MPPPARRETRLYPAPPGANSDLQRLQANFDQFKRKHINQNRDIIKTNALGQLRMRELENRIHALESDKADQALEMNRLLAKVRKLEHAHAFIRQGWQLMSTGMKAVDSSRDESGAEGLDRQTHQGTSPALYGLGLGMESSQQQLPADPLHQKSSRIYLDRSILPAGVVRSIARAPGAHIIDVMEGEESEEDTAEEEEGEEDNHHEAWNQSQMERGEETLRIFSPDEEGQEEVSEITPRLEAQAKFNPEWQATNVADCNSNSQPASASLSPSGSHSSESLLELAAAIASTGSAGLSPNAQTLWQHTPFDAEGAPSPLASPPLVFDEAGLANNVWGIYVSDPTGLARIQQESASTSNPPPQSKVVKARRSSRRHSGLLSVPSTQDDSEGALPTLSRASSMTSLTDYESLPDDSPFDSELDEGEKVPSAEMPSQHESLKSSDEDGINSEKNLVKKEKGKRKTLTKRTSMGKLEGTTSEAVTPGERKRKLTSNSPDSTSSVDNGRSRKSDATSIVDEDIGGRSSRRTRKSVNYALPKLNTKMRKPDPVDLIPASATSVTSRSAAPTTNRFSASSGNLSDIRRLHEAQRAEGKGASVDEEHAKDEEERETTAPTAPSPSSSSASGSKGVSRKVWGSSSISGDEHGPSEESIDLIEHSREVTDQDFEHTTDEDVVGPSMPRRRQVSAEAEETPSSSGSSGKEGSKSSDSSSNSRRPSLRRRSDTLPARTLTPSKAENSAQETSSLSSYKGKSSSTPCLPPGTAQTTISSDSARSKPSYSNGGQARSSHAGKGREHEASTSDSGIPLPERPRTYSGKTAAKAGMSEGVSGVTSLGRAALAASRERGSLHAALTDGLEQFFSPSRPPIKSSASDGSAPAIGGKKELGISHPRASLSTTTVGSLSSADSSGRNSPALSVSSQGSSSGKPPASASNRQRSNLAPAATPSRPASVPPARPSSGASASSSPSLRELSSPRIVPSKAPSGVNRQRVQVVVRHAPSNGSVASSRSGSNTSTSSTSTVTGKEKETSNLKSPSSPSKKSHPSSASSASLSGSKRPVNRRISSSSS